MTTRLMSSLYFILTLAIFMPLHAQERPNQSIIRYDTIHHPIKANGGMVASQNHIATDVGAAILSKGGNAVDAAVATGFALAVTVPRAGNIGGGGFMMVRMADSDATVAIDYCSIAPLASNLELFKGENGRVDRGKSRFGYIAPAVPGTVAGLYEAHKRFGKLKWSEVVAPAIELAEEGIKVSHDLSNVLKSQAWNMKTYPASKRAFFKKDGDAYEAGDILKQPALAWSLKQIQQGGADAFYKGKIAKLFAADMKKNGGLITLEDLASYKVAVRTPTTVNYRGVQIDMMPPPSGGGVLMALAFNVLSEYDIKAMGSGSAAATHVIAEVFKHAYADRSEHLGDPDFYDVPISTYTSKTYAMTIAKKINMDRAMSVEDIYPGELTTFKDVGNPESRDTTQFSVVDRDGNMVSNTYTLGYSFGSGVVVEGAGFLLDNQMNNFAHNVGIEGARGIQASPANALVPGKRMASTMTPTIVIKDGKPWLATGTPGGNRIITTVLQVLVNSIDHGMNIAEAIERPRFHQNWTDGRLKIEAGFSPDTVAKLRALGHNVLLEDTMGSVQSVAKEGALFMGASDTRRPGAASVGVE